MSGWRWIGVFAVVGCGGGDGSNSDGATTDGPTGTTEPTSPTTPTADLQTDTFVQTPPPPIDLLLMVDSSGSMEDNQLALGGQYAKLVQPWLDSYVSVRIGLVSADFDTPGESGLLHLIPDSTTDRWFEGDDPNLPLAFGDWVHLGANGSGSEHGLDAVSVALDPTAEPRNAGFLRDDARLEIVILSDEDDQSDQTEPADLIAQLTALKQDPAWVHFNTVIRTAPDQHTGPSPGKRYVAVQDVIGGDLYDIDSNWNLAATSARMEPAQNTWPLSGTPVAGTLAVAVTSAEGEVLDVPADGWNRDAAANAVVFDKWMPPPGATIAVSYEVAP